MAQDLAHRRPWLLLSLLFGLSYPLVHFFPLPGLYAIMWKMAAVGMLVGFALRRHHNGDFWAVAGIMALYSLGDGLIEIELLAGGAAFSLAHILAIWLYCRHRRAETSFSQNLLAATVLIIAPAIAYFLGGGLAAAYTLLLCIMAAAAWTSSFPRYRTGLGAMLFVLSDLLLFGREGGMLMNLPAIDPLVWYSYYCGVLLIAVGTVQTLVKQGNQAT